jgi:cobalt/nickel transport system permease protein
VSALRTALPDFEALESLANKSSTLSTLDARAKVLVTLTFIVTVVSFDRYTVAGLLPLFLFPVVLTSLGNIPTRVIARGVLWASPFAVMVGVFNPIFDQQVMLTVAGLGISGGWLSFASILIRFALTVSAGLVLVASTGFAPLCEALRRLGVPRLFTTQLLMLNRYMLVLADEAARMSLARELRASGRAMPLTVYGPLLGHLLLRSVQRAQRIHQAMLSRGFNGQLQHHATLKWQPRDTVFVGTCLAGLVLTRQFDLTRLVGQHVLGWIR